MDVLLQVCLVFLFVTYNALPSIGLITDVRLVNGPSRLEGTVEYTTDNVTWQTTCGVNFGFDDARLVCQHIGAHGTNKAIANSTFGRYFDPPKSHLNCKKGDSDISDCKLAALADGKPCPIGSIGAAICYDDTYLGCHKDNSSDRVLSGDPLIGDSTMTIDKCITHCRESTMADYPDYSYAGVEYGEECFCGVAGTNYSRLGAAENGDEDCQFQCAGDSQSSCGGTGHIAVFQIPESSQPVTSPTTVIERTGDADTRSVTVLISNTIVMGSTTTDDMPVSSTTSAITKRVGNTSTLAVAAGAGGGIAAIVIILVVIIVVVVLYKRRHGRDARKESSNPHHYEDCVNYAVNKEPQLNMGFAKDQEDLSSLYAVTTKNRPEPEGADLGDLYAMPDKRKKSHVTRNGASKAMKPSTQESTTPVTGALYAMPDKKKKATNPYEDRTEMVENIIYT